MDEVNCFDDCPDLPIIDVAAERVIIGSLLFDNSRFAEVPIGFSSNAFYAPLHGEIFTAIVDRIRIGELVEPVGLAQVMATDEAFVEAGGVSYLALMIEYAAPRDRLLQEFCEYVERCALVRNRIAAAWRNEAHVQLL